MAKEKFVLVSLKEDKAKKLAQVITNDSCRKILDYLADKDATESELAKELNLPISTVHYNLQQLVNGGLVIVDEFHYSPKGKEVNHYKLANKYIIIAPKTTYGIKEKLRSILPVVGLGIIGAGFLHFFSKGFVGKSATFAGGLEAPVIESARAPVMEKAMIAAPMAEEAVMETAKPVVEEAASQVAEPMMEAATQTVVSQATVPLWQSIALWFLIGVIFSVVLYLIIERVRKK